MAWEADEGRMMWRFVWEEMDTEVEVANEGLRIAAVRGSRFGEEEAG